MMWYFVDGKYIVLRTRRAHNKRNDDKSPIIALIVNKDAGMYIHFILLTYFLSLCLSVSLSLSLSLSFAVTPFLSFFLSICLCLLHSLYFFPSLIQCLPFEVAGWVVTAYQCWVEQGPTGPKAGTIMQYRTHAHTNAQEHTVYTLSLGCWLQFPFLHISLKQWLF